MSIGKDGEQFFKNCSEQMNYKVEDLSEIEEFWYKDIDFKLTSSATGVSKYFEVKTDTLIANTGNLFIETWSRDTIQPKHRGWFLVCEADYISYIDWKNKIIHTFLLDELKELISSHNYPKAANAEAEGYLVPLAAVRQLPSYREVA